MEHFSGTTYFVASEPMTTTEFSTDASLVGGGGRFRVNWFYINWKSDYPELLNSHINDLGIFTVLLGLRHWGPRLANNWIVNYTDNNVMKSWLNKGTSKSCKVMSWL